MIGEKQHLVGFQELLVLLVNGLAETKYSPAAAVELHLEQQQTIWRPLISIWIISDGDILPIAWSEDLVGEDFSQLIVDILGATQTPNEKYLLERPRISSSGLWYHFVTEN